MGGVFPLWNEPEKEISNELKESGPSEGLSQHTAHTHTPVSISENGSIGVFVCRACMLVCALFSVASMASPCAAGLMAGKVSGFEVWCVTTVCHDYRARASAASAGAVLDARAA
jgi:hypothetical protein